MSYSKAIPEILCLRPKQDFLDVGVIPPKNLQVHYKDLAEDHIEIEHLKVNCKALVIPAVGKKIKTSFFAGTNIKMVQITGAGFDRLEVNKLREKNINVCNISGGSDQAVAEYCHTGAILVSRQLLSLTGASPQEYGDIRVNMIKTKMNSLDGMTVGIIGYGNIGKCTASFFRKSGCKILVYDPLLTDTKFLDEPKIKKTDISNLLRESDIVSIHTPKSESTTNLIDSAEIALMKPNSILINAARGGIVNELALAKAITDSKIGGAVVDVYSSEPPSPDNPLFMVPKPQINRLMLTPHIAGVTSQAWNELFNRSWQNILDFILNKSPKYVIN